MEMEVCFASPPSPSSSSSIHSDVRRHLLQLLISSSQQLLTPPIVKYTALTFFMHRFLPSLPRALADNSSRSWLLSPLRESNLELFALISIWIASKIHDSKPLSVKSLKSFGDKFIGDQHFTARDFVEAEMVFMEVLRFDIGASQIAFTFMEDLLIHLRELSKFGELISLDVCMDIMDILYDTEDSSLLFRWPSFLAATILVVAYVLSVPKQEWEFPIIPWVKFVTSFDEEEIEAMVHNILLYVLKPETEDRFCRNNILLDLN